MGEYVHKAHNALALIYHIGPAKYRRVVNSEEVEEADKTLKETGGEIEKRYGIKFLEIGTEGDRVHFLV
jgi:hypothetical protein